MLGNAVWELLKFLPATILRRIFSAEWLAEKIIY